MTQFFILFILLLAYMPVQADKSVPTLPAAAQSATMVNPAKSEVKKYYSSLTLGVGVYPEVNNIDKGYNANLAMGYYLKNRAMLELGLGLAKSQLNTKNLLITDRNDTFNVDQYQVVAVAKYPFNELSATGLNPNLGLALAYTMRSYNLLNGLTNNSGKTGGSTAFDAGLNAGVDYIFNKTYAAGLDFKYMFNVSNQISSNYSSPGYGYRGLTIESLQYYTAGLSARMNF